MLLLSTNDRDHKGKLWSYLDPEGSDVVVYYSGHGVPGLADRKGYTLTHRTSV